MLDGNSYSNNIRGLPVVYSKSQSFIVNPLAFDFAVSLNLDIDGEKDLKEGKPFIWLVDCVSGSTQVHCLYIQARKYGDFLQLVKDCQSDLIKQNLIIYMDMHVPPGYICYFSQFVSIYVAFARKPSNCTVLFYSYVEIFLGNCNIS